MIQKTPSLSQKRLRDRHLLDRSFQQVSACFGIVCGALGLASMLVMMKSKELKISRFVPLMLILSIILSLQPS